MSHVNADRVLETVTTTGTGAYTLSGTPVPGFRAFDTAMATNDTCHYSCQAVDANGNPSGGWEIGVGSFNTNILTRIAILASSNGGAAVNWGAGNKRVFITTPGNFVNLAARRGLIESRQRGVLIVDYQFKSNPPINDTNVVAVRKLIRENPHVKFAVVMNTASSGPGEVQVADIWTTMKLYIGDGALPIGYVTTGYFASKTVQNIVDEALLWRSLYPGIRGIFLDEFGYAVGDNTAPLKAAKRALNRELRLRLEALGFQLFANAGVQLEAAWYGQSGQEDVIGPNMVVGLSEGAAFPTESGGPLTQQGDETTQREFNVVQRALILNNQATLDIAAFEAALKNYGWFWIASDAFYFVIPTYADLAARMVGGVAKLEHGAIRLEGVSAVPPVPSANGVLMYARSRAGRMLPEFLSPAGVDNPLQPALFGNRVMVVSPGSGTGVTAFGITPTTAATLSHPTPAITTLAESLYRTRFQTSTTAGNAAGVRSAVNMMWRGNAAGRGGFFCHFRVATGSVSLVGGQKFAGLTSSTGALAGEPSSSLNDAIGLCKDSADTNWFFTRRTGTGAAVKVDLGIAVANNVVLDIVLYSRPNGSDIGVRIVRHNFDGTITVLLDTTYNTSIPAAATLLGFALQVRNGAVAAADNLEMVRMYVESDF
jgi:hypothetical protein